MKKGFASIELIRVVKELRERLINGKINQIYVDFDRVGNTKKELLFECYVPNKGKQILRVLLPSLIYITATKPQTPEKPDGYCLYLRKYLKNARIVSIEQLGAERILKFIVEAKDLTKTEYTPLTYHIYFELFSKGNMIFANANDIILSPLEVQEWSDRVVKPKQPYTHPKQEYNIFKMEEADFIAAVEKSTKESIVTTLALDLGLGGIYAEEICARAAVPKDKKPTKEELHYLYDALQKLLKDLKESKPLLIKEENKIVDVYPCAIQKYAGIQEECSFLEAVDKSVPQTAAAAFSPSQKTEDKTLQKLQTMIRMQEAQIKTCEQEYDENKKKGDFIYEKYKQIEDILTQFHEVRKTKSWQEIKKAAKQHVVIKQINEKNHEIVVEL
ncbi:NFACT family protein [Candidatus Woesearchaeota archaeon]|nr:NFACT family protein [Candidatus Woesearchaeota archaeon]